MIWFYLVGRDATSGPSPIPTHRASVGSNLPPGMSLICSYIAGPKAGQTQNFAGVSGATPAPIGTGCGDGQGSFGTAIAQSDPGPIPPPPGPNLPPGMSLTCAYTSGLKAGRTQDFSAVPGAIPTRVGSPCSDGQGSVGTATAQPSEPGPIPPPPGPNVLPGISLTCAYTSGLKAGQTQDFSGVPGAIPARIGSPCSDGQGSFGAAQ
jgi:hypothetical protein